MNPPASLQWEAGGDCLEGLCEGYECITQPLSWLRDPLSCSGYRHRQEAVGAAWRVGASLPDASRDPYPVEDVVRPDLCLVPHI